MKASVASPKWSDEFNSFSRKKRSFYESEVDKKCIKVCSIKLCQCKANLFSTKGSKWAPLKTDSLLHLRWLNRAACSRQSQRQPRKPKSVTYIKVTYNGLSSDEARAAAAGRLLTKLLLTGLLFLTRLLFTRLLLTGSLSLSHMVCGIERPLSKSRTPRLRKLKSPTESLLCLGSIKEVPELLSRRSPRSPSLTRSLPSLTRSLFLTRLLLFTRSTQPEQGPISLPNAKVSQTQVLFCWPSKGQTRIQKSVTYKKYTYKCLSCRSVGESDLEASIPLPDTYNPVTEIQSKPKEAREGLSRDKPKANLSSTPKRDTQTGPVLCETFPGYPGTYKPVTYFVKSSETRAQPLTRSHLTRSPFWPCKSSAITLNVVRVTNWWTGELSSEPNKRMPVTHSKVANLRQHELKPPGTEGWELNLAGNAPLTLCLTLIERSSSLGFAELSSEPHKPITVTYSIVTYLSLTELIFVRAPAGRLVSMLRLETLGKILRGPKLLINLSLTNQSLIPTVPAPTCTSMTRLEPPGKSSKVTHKPVTYESVTYLELLPPGAPRRTYDKPFFGSGPRTESYGKRSQVTHKSVTHKSITYLELLLSGAPRSVYDKPKKGVEPALSPQSYLPANINVTNLRTPSLKQTQSQTLINWYAIPSPSLAFNGTECICIRVAGRTNTNLRHLTKTIEKDLLQSGDVERNPGPGQQPRLPETKLTLVTQNCRGLAEVRKLKHLLNNCHKIGKESECFIVALQETMIADEQKLKFGWRGTHVFTPGTGHGRGCITLMPSHMQPIPGSILHLDQRAHIFKVQIGQSLAIVANLYSPTGHTRDKIEFFRTVKSEIELMREPTDAVYLMGDLNTVFSTDEVYSRSFSLQEQRHSHQIKQIIESLSLKDIWQNDRHTHTWRQPGTKKSSRLDRIYYHHLLTDKGCTVDWTFTNSDHGAVVATFTDVNKVHRSKPLRLNPELLRNKALRAAFVDDYRRQIEQIPPTWDPHTKLEFHKCAIRSAYTQVNTENKRKEKLDYQLVKEDLHSHIAALEENKNDAAKANRLMNKINKLKATITKLNLEKGQLLADRLKTKWYNEGERSNKYFLGILRRKEVNGTLTELEIDNRVESNPDEIEKHVVSFYKSLYNQAQPNPTAQESNEMLRLLQPLNDEERRHINKPLTTEMLGSTLKHTQDSCPGPDGIPYSYLKVTWQWFGPV